MISGEKAEKEAGKASVMETAASFTQHVQAHHCKTHAPVLLLFLLYPTAAWGNPASSQAPWDVVSPSSSVSSSIQQRQSKLPLGKLQRCSRWGLQDGRHQAPLPVPTYRHAVVTCPLPSQPAPSSLPSILHPYTRSQLLHRELILGFTCESVGSFNILLSSEAHSPPEKSHRIAAMLSGVIKKNISAKCLTWELNASSTSG